MMGTKMKHTKSSIRELINRSDKAVERGLIVLYDRQTQDEKQVDATRHHNNRGFNHGDAKRGSYYARWVISGRSLTDHHLIRARRMLQKYCGQLAVIANAKATAEAA